MKDLKCKICRRQGAKLFLKGERCLTTKCSVVRRSYPPGIKKKRKLGSLSEYGKELMEKQKLKKWYNLRERQFRNYVKKILAKKGRIKDASNSLIVILEIRLDNVIFRLGLASSRPQAKQLISHGYFFVNGKAINIPSYSVKKGDIITLRPQKKKKTIFQNIQNLLKKYKTPSWLIFDAEKLEGKVIGEPSLEEVAPPAEVSSIFEFYSR